MVMPGYGNEILLALAFYKGVSKGWAFRSVPYVSHYYCGTFVFMLPCDGRIYIMRIDTPRIRQKLHISLCFLDCLKNTWICFCGRDAREDSNAYIYAKKTIFFMITCLLS